MCVCGCVGSTETGARVAVLWLPDRRLDGARAACSAVQPVSPSSRSRHLHQEARLPASFHLNSLIRIRFLRKRKK